MMLGDLARNTPVEHSAFAGEQDHILPAESVTVWDDEPADVKSRVHDNTVDDVCIGGPDGGAQNIHALPGVVGSILAQ